MDFAKDSDRLGYVDAENTRNYIRKNLIGERDPEIGIICGSGLGGLANSLKDPQIFNYSDIPNFMKSTVHGHAGRLVFGWLGGKYVVCMQGRFHHYEGYSLNKVTFPIRVLARLGIQVLVVTNASGSLNMEYRTGDIVIIRDHINLAGMIGNNPLMGPNDDRFGPRFLATSHAYDPKLRSHARDVSRKLGMNNVHEGVYVYQVGPCFESVAESRMLNNMGADIAGMSTVPEVVVARHCGVRCVGLSLVTNCCVMQYRSGDKVEHDHVLTSSNKYGQLVKDFVENFVAEIDIGTIDKRKASIAF